MHKYKELERNYKIIKKFAIRYRKELTVHQGAIGELCGEISCSDYVKFMNNLSDGEFVGNMLCSLLAPHNIKMFEQILDGKKDFDIFVTEYLPDDARIIYNVNISK